MKKKTELACLLFAVVLVAIGIFLRQKDNSIILYMDKESIALGLTENGKSTVIYPYLSEDGQYYFFMPSFVKTNIVYVEDESFFVWEENVSYTIKSAKESAEDREFQIKFMHSENLPSVFIATESGSLDYIHENVDHAESGNIRVLTADGDIQYSGSLEYFSGRGNSTWDYPKKPYAIKLKNPAGLCGMDIGKRWNLMAMWQESTKMNTKLAFDMANELKLPYSPQGEWVDLYINHEYVGLYLLTESISVGEGRVDIHDLERENESINPGIESAASFYEDGYKGVEIENSRDITGGYLLEKQWSPFFREERSGFITSNGFKFGITSPEYAFWEQVLYIKDFVQKVEDSIDSGEYTDYIDLESFVKKYLVEEISLNYDANIGSTYFYKERGKDILCAGPVWDYDGTFGEHGEDVLNGKYTDYKWSILNPRLSGNEVLDWFGKLYEEKEFNDLMKTEYAKLLPWLEETLEKRIDSYEEIIEKAVKMDHMRWPGEVEEGHYLAFENNVRYLKYFLANRLNYLNQCWQIQYKTLGIPSNGEQHKVSFLIDGQETAAYQAEDGKSMTELPNLDEEVYQGWYLFNGEEKYRDSLPVYEDMILYGKEK